MVGVSGESWRHKSTLSPITVVPITVVPITVVPITVVPITVVPITVVPWGVMVGVSGGSYCGSMGSDGWCEW